MVNFVEWVSQESLMKVEKYHRNKNIVLAVENEIQFLQVHQDTATLTDWRLCFVFLKTISQMKCPDKNISFPARKTDK